MRKALAAPGLLEMIDAQSLEFKSFNRTCDKIVLKLQCRRQGFPHSPWVVIEDLYNQILTGCKFCMPRR